MPTYTYRFSPPAIQLPHFCAEGDLSAEAVAARLIQLREPLRMEPTCRASYPNYALINAEGARVGLVPWTEALRLTRSGVLRNTEGCVSRSHATYVAWPERDMPWARAVALLEENRWQAVADSVVIGSAEGTNAWRRVAETEFEPSPQSGRTWHEGRAVVADEMERAFSGDDPMGAKDALAAVYLRSHVKLLGKEGASNFERSYAEALDYARAYQETNVDCPEDEDMRWLGIARSRSHWLSATSYPEELTMDRLAREGLLEREESLSLHATLGCDPSIRRCYHRDYGGGAGETLSALLEKRRGAWKSEGLEPFSLSFWTRDERVTYEMWANSPEEAARLTLWYSDYNLTSDHEIIVNHVSDNEYEAIARRNPEDYFREGIESIAVRSDPELVARVVFAVEKGVPGEDG